MPVICHIGQDYIVKTQLNTKLASKKLVPLSLGSRVLYDKNPDKNSKRPEWAKGIIKNKEEPSGKYTITKDNSMSVTRTRRDIRQDGSYVTQSGRISRPPDCLIEKM